MNMSEDVSWGMARRGITIGAEDGAIADAVNGE